jgi:hypothetical protein
VPGEGGEQPVVIDGLQHKVCRPQGEGHIPLVEQRHQSSPKLLAEIRRCTVTPKPGPAGA